MGMTTTDTAGLCERLRAYPANYPRPFNPDGLEAADALERQAAKIKQLEKALAAIGNTPTGGLGCNPVGMVKTARAALTGEDPCTS